MIKNGIDSQNESIPFLLWTIFYIIVYNDWTDYT